MPLPAVIGLVSLSLVETVVTCAPVSPPPVCLVPSRRSTPPQSSALVESVPPWTGAIALSNGDLMPPKSFMGTSSIPARLFAHRRQVVLLHPGGVERELGVAHLGDRHPFPVELLVADVGRGNLIAELRFVGLRERQAEVGILAVL